MILVGDLAKEHIEAMVYRFYTKVLADDVIGSIFIDKLGDDLERKRWQAHLKLISSFWISIAFGERVYNGSPLAPHLKLEGLKKEHFKQWLKLFSETTDAMYEPGLAHMFQKRATIIAGNFMRNLKLGEL
jgi:hemoglobin